MTKFRTPSFNQGSVSKKIKTSPAPNKNFDLILKICISNIWQRNKYAETKIEFKAKRRSNSDKNNNQKPTGTSPANSFKYSRQGLSQETLLKTNETNTEARRVRKNPCWGSYQTKRSKQGPNPRHHWPPFNECVHDTKTKKDFDNKEDYTKQISNSHFHKIIVRQIKRKNVRTFHKRKISCSKVNKVSTHKSSNQKNAGKGFSQKFCENKRHRNRSGTTKYRTS